MMQRVRRPLNVGEVHAGRTALKEALDAEGVPRGGWYLVERDEPADLSGPGAVRNKDPETAREARFNPNITEARERVLIALLELGERNSQEIADHLRKDRSSVSPRMNEMGPGGTKEVVYVPHLMEKTGGTRLNEKTGYENEAWRLTERGVLEARRLKGELDGSLL